MSHAVASYVYRKNMFYNQTSLKVISTKYRPLPIPSGGLEFLLLLQFSCPEQKRLKKMKNFVDSLYDYNYSRVTTKKAGKTGQLH